MEGWLWYGNVNSMEETVWLERGSGLFDEVPSEQSPEEVREPAIHLSPGRVVWERDLLVIDH